MVPQTPSRYYQASPAPERAPRAKNGQAAVPDIFELSGLAVSRAATRVPGIPPDHSPTLGRSVRATLQLTKPEPGQLCSSSTPGSPRTRVNARRFISLNVLETCVSCRARVDAKLGRSAERQTLAAASTAATQRSAAAAHRLKQRPPAPAGESRSAWKSAQEPARRLRRRRAATDDGRRAHQFRAASPHRRGGHG